MNKIVIKRILLIISILAGVLLGLLILALPFIGLGRAVLETIEMVNSYGVGSFGSTGLEQFWIVIIVIVLLAIACTLLFSAGILLVYVALGVISFVLSFKEKTQKASDIIGFCYSCIALMSFTMFSFGDFIFSLSMLEENGAAALLYMLPLPIMFLLMVALVFTMIVCFPKKKKEIASEN